MSKILNTDQLTNEEIEQIAIEIDATPNAELKELAEEWRDDFHHVRSNCAEELEELIEDNE